MFRRTGGSIWYFDIICDVWIVADMLVTLVTVVPKGSFAGFWNNTRQVRGSSENILPLKIS